MLATTVRRRLRGNEVTYVRVADLKVEHDEVDRGADRRSADRWHGWRSADLSDAADARRGDRSRGKGARPGRDDVPLSAFCLFELGKLPEGLPVVLPALKKGRSRERSRRRRSIASPPRARARSAGRCGAAVGAIDGQRNAGA